jgi:GWxTD domain-containing protein
MRRQTFVLSLVLLVPMLGWAKDAIKMLPPHYREWLTRDVVYIITDEEKQAFLRLGGDEERDKFIEHFWEIRNPDPGSPANAYKDEIYRRIAYADQFYGHYSGAPGWSTDRGRVYITLGPPEQVGKYLGFANVRPMEIWFYSNGHPALPPFFYVVFYQRETAAEFRLYSPFMDGPDKLVTGAGYENDKVKSWKLIDHDAGPEVARTVLSLIPNEPVDTDTATSSLTSDMLLNNIRGLANHPLNKELLQQKRELLESVSHRVVLGAGYLDILTVPLVDAAGETNVHYALQLKRPEDFPLAEDKDNRHYYSATVNARVLTADGKLIFSAERKLSQYLDERQLVKVKDRVFGYDGLLPLPPGKYKLQFELTDDIKRTAYPGEREVVVLDRPADSVRITDVVPFSEAFSGQASFLPFTAAGVRFTPVKESLSLVPGQALEFFYQVWAPPQNSKSSAEGDLQVEYAYGRMGMHDTQTIKEDLPRNQFDANGTLVNGKKIATTALPPGEYRMAITVSDPATRSRSSATFLFRLVDTLASLPIWDITDPQSAEDVEMGRRDYQRALCYASQGDQQKALTYLRKAYKKNSDEQTRDKLVNVLYSRQAFAEIADLYVRGGVTAETDEQTILDMAESLNRLGQMAKSIQLLERALPLHPSSVLYLGLARYYQISGDSRKASAMQEKAKAIAAQPTG